MSDQRTKLETAYRSASDKVELSANPTLRDIKAADDAWDRLSELCDDLLQCKQIGCRNVSPEYAYCSEHRPS